MPPFFANLLPEGHLRTYLAAHAGVKPEREFFLLAALGFKRFDRGSGGRRIHMEDFAQVFGRFPEDKYARHSYANLAAVLWAETTPEDTYAFVRRLVFSVLIGNGDMHLKNWSLLYPDARTPVLSPAYDFVSTVPYVAGDELALTFGGSRGLDGIAKDQVRRFADAARLPVSPVWQIVRETAEKTVEAWRALEARDALPGELREQIDRQIETAVRGVEF